MCCAPTEGRLVEFKYLPKVGARSIDGRLTSSLGSGKRVDRNRKLICNGDCHDADYRA